ncbi:MAG: amidohydrolase family protein [Proteobacteria bacterium]|nr:amidohydrolase family protein [Pseudomonadota bacterium]
MTLVIHDTTVVTVDPDDRVVYGGAVAIEADRVAAVGPSAEILARYPRAERIDGTGKAVLPGLANTHTHFLLAIARGIYEDLSPPNRPPFTAGGGLSTLPTPKLTPEEQVAIARLAALEALRSGTTAVLEDWTEVDAYLEPLIGTGLRFLFCERAWDKVNGSIGDTGPFQRDAKLADTTLARIESLHCKWHGAAGGRIRIGVSAWAPDMCSPELLRDLRGLQDRLGVPATIHLNQIWGEVAAVKTIRNRLPTEYLDDVGFLSEHMIGAHCRCMEPHEERLLGRHRVSVAFNSCIAARRGLSPRIHDLESYGCNIGLGTDNMAEDMVEVTRTAMFMERVRRGDGRQPSPEQALRWATVNGYRAMGIPDGGSLVAGNKADLIMIDLRRAHLVPALRVVSVFVHQGQGRDVTDAMVDGKWLMRHGRVLTMDEDQVVAEAERVASAAWRRLFDSRPDLKPPPGFAYR